MTLKYALVLASYIGILVLASPVVLHSGLNSSDDLTHTHQPSGYLTLNLESTSPSNGSMTSLSVTGSKDTHIKCDGASYGVDLEIIDCEQAKAHLPASSDQLQWAQRNTGWQKRIFSLPYRAMGDQASCYVQPILVNGVTSAKATPNQVRNAAAMIRSRCASGGKLQGGIATNIGKMKASLLKDRDRFC